MTRRVRCPKATVVFVGALALALLASVPGVQAAGKKGGAGAGLGFSENECKLLGGTVEPAPGPQPGTFECCFSKNDCHICSPSRPCDPVDWGDVNTGRLENPRLSAAARPAGLAVRTTKPGSPGILEKPEPRILERSQRARTVRDHRARRAGILERPTGSYTARDHRSTGGPMAQQARAPSRPGHTDGGQCTVLSGPNKGEKGTFDEGYCCDEKDWGCTDCTDTSGGDNGKCKATRQASILERPAFQGSKDRSKMRAR
jgi:hypothetical protein